MINHVGLWTRSAKTIDLVMDLDANQYTVHREVRQEKDRDVTAEAQALLEDDELKNTCSVTILGDCQIDSGKCL